MKIKVCILFCFLFWGIGFDGFGQELIRRYPFQMNPIITADTVVLSMEEKEELLRKCEKVGVISDSTYRGFANYLHKIDKKSFQNSQVYNGLFKDWMPIDSDNDKKTDFVVLLKAHNATGGEGYMCAIWKKNKKGEFDFLNAWNGTIVEINKKEESISIKVIEHGCCADFLYCENVYEYEKRKLKRKYQLCYTYRFDLVEQRVPVGSITTTDSAEIYIASDSVLAKSYAKFPGIEEHYNYEKEWKIGSYATIKSNQKGELLFSKKEGNMYWYFVVFREKSVKRIVRGWWNGDRNVSGWMKSKTPLKIESK
ncbi:hypothetical protein Fleli_2033 [Bernardetia litoralis DSM 6794]|uniref:Uncharacterized protein n=1 Tax=Bernardetia litoralis (strain ATCC 23117 / DSM 6794 / NBRC 15988 / NCIMB 1366 / Fx l1 / Sio-4) TaxID=880071 RepID=I4AKD2_BERLS|nr:hypothetical protein [Bernardetia litoralis]AFM04417.1 hypothetical protein Fleli_2033 [Bernardetia litoralis DSM 6794]